MPRVRRSDIDQKLADEYGADFLTSLARGMRVLSVFDEADRQFTLSDVAKTVDLPRATVRRSLYTLTCLGYLESDGKHFSLAPKILSLASAYLVSNGRAAVLQRAVEAISQEVGETCSAAVRDGDDVVFVARLNRQRIISEVGLDIGYRLPAYCTSVGRVLLGELDDAELTAYLNRVRPEGLTETTVVDRTSLRAAIERDRAIGYSIVDEEVELGFRSIAVPVARYDGTIVAALNIGVHVDRVSMDTLVSSHLPVLKRHAEELRHLIVQ